MQIASATHMQFGAAEAPAEGRITSAILLALVLFLVVMTGFATAHAGESPTTAASIVVTIPLAAPDSTEQDVATHYRLEPIERRSSQVLERRIVVYRIPDGRAQAEVLRQISLDARVSSAQPNLEYLPPSDRTPDPVVAGRTRENTPPGKAARRATASAGKLEPDRRRTAPPRLALAPETRALPREASVALIPRSRISSLGGNQAWPTADEPFVGTPSSR
ncbi:MAG: hypothetical protein ACKVP3_26615 [Hyphomicrobiaceae bacterium]